MIHAVRLTIEGNEQGVGYRAWFARQAEKADLCGWVRNRRDGKVEALVIGKAEVLSAFIQSCWQGPTAARVDRITDQAYTGSLPSSFEILPTS